MTEKELQAIEEEVLAGEEVPLDFEVPYLKTALGGWRVKAREIKCSFRTFKYVRDDERMKAAQKDMKRVREYIEAIEERLRQLNSIGDAP